MYVGGHCYIVRLKSIMESMQPLHLPSVELQDNQKITKRPLGENTRKEQGKRFLSTWKKPTAPSQKPLQRLVAPDKQRSNVWGEGCCVTSTKRAKGVES